MTTEQKQALAAAIASLQDSEIEEVANLSFDAVVNARTSQQVASFYQALFAAGIDAGPICKKKRPQ